MLEFFPGNYRWSFNTLLAFTGGAQLGDFELIRAELVKHTGDDACWASQWSALAEIARERADAALSPRSRSEELFLASLYLLVAERMLDPKDSLRERLYEQMLCTFAQASAEAPVPMHRAAIPFEGAELAAWLLPAAGPATSPCCIFLSGADTSKELWYLRARDTFRERGVSCLFVDTPGVGEALRRHGMATRHDYEKPVAALVDWLHQQAGIDGKRIGLVGSSFGGYYAARAAAFEPRLRAAAAWGAIHDYPEIWRRRMAAPGFDPSAQSAFLHLTGQQSLEAALHHVRDFRVADIAGHIERPFLILHGARDTQVPLEQAQVLFDAVGAKDKTLWIFDGRNGGSAHTQFDNPRPAMLMCADWMASRLYADSTAPSLQDRA